MKPCLAPSRKRCILAFMMFVFMGTWVTTSDAAPPGPVSAGGPTDTQIQIAVSQAMQTSALTANSLIIVHVTEGEVTLEGSAISPLAQREATRLAETVIGVREIRNRLSVPNTQTAEIPRSP